MAGRGGAVGRGLGGVLAAMLMAGCSVLGAVGGGGSGSPAPPAGPHEAVRQGGGLLFLAGQLGTRDDGTLVPGGVQPETRRALEKIKALVESEGSTMDRVVKCTVFLADIAEWDAMNVEYAKFFPGRKPARTAVGGIGIPRLGRVEIECVAAVG